MTSTINVASRRTQIVIGGVAAALTLIALVLPLKAGAAGAPIIATPTFSTTPTSAAFKTTVDPNSVKVKDFHFDYISQSDYVNDGNSFGAGTISTPSVEIQIQVKGTGNLTIGGNEVTNLTTSQGTFAVGQTITATGLPAGTTITAVSATTLTLSKAATATSPGPANLIATGPQPVEATVEGLTPASGYRLRAVATNGKATPETTTTPTRAFFTRAPSPDFGSCPNEAFRSGAFAPFGHPSAALPDCRAYEQATPVNKDGGDAKGYYSFTRAAATGAGVTFGSTFGIPGGSGAQRLPFYAALRGEGDSGWQTQGLLPPATTGAKANVVGWLPDFSQTFSEGVQLGAPRHYALYELHRDGEPPTQMTPYLPHSGDSGLYSYAGASADGRVVIFEASAALPATPGEATPLPGAREGSPNVYAWDANSGKVSLASVLNTLPEGEAALPKGAFAGPYSWGTSTTNGGGASSVFPGNFLQETHAVSADGSLFFTAQGSGQLYRRINPTQPQSHLNAQNECDEPEKACTIHLSRSERHPADPVGPAPAAFQYASSDGSVSYFTSSEELTEDANTGPPQPQAQIGRAALSGDEATDVKEDFLPAHALGLATSPDGQYIYWADPITGDIGRAELHEGAPTNPDPTYIDTGETEFTYNREAEELPNVLLKARSTPRYVAADDEYVYWTNTGPQFEEPGFPQFSLGGAGTVGRAKIDPATGEVEEIEPEFITGASNPQGIAVNATRIYWGNSEGSTRGATTFKSIGRANIDGTLVEQEFYPLISSPRGVALDASHVYFAEETSNGHFGSIVRIPLDGLQGEGYEFVVVSSTGIGGIDIGGSNVYWANPGNGTIGRNDLGHFAVFGTANNAHCAGSAECDLSLVAPSGSLTGGPAIGPDNRLYWSVNGETPPHPGNDLYRYQSDASEPLTDLTPDSTDPDGAEVLGFLGGSADGSYIYFVANADLDESGPAGKGNCVAEKTNVTQVTGECNLYLYHQGGFSLVAHLRPHGEDSLAWLPGSKLGGGIYKDRTSIISPDGKVLLFFSAQNLTEYDSHGTSELYRFSATGGAISCLSCNPSGEAPTQKTAGAGFDSIRYNTSLEPGSPPAPTVPRFLTDNGNRAFFESSEALVPADTNGLAGCPTSSSQGTSQCQDVYEWEAPETGNCEVDGPGYSPLSEGCIYLISTGKATEPAYFADASADGSNVFFFTREPLVGQDTDQIKDVYDARIDGGLEGQNPLPPIECEAEGCKGPSPAPPAFAAPPQFSGPPNPQPKRPKCTGKRGCKKHHRKHHKKKHHKKHGPTHRAARGQGGSK